MFESYYSLSNFVIYFSDFIMPLRILLFSLEFCYSLSNYVMQLSNSIIRLYSSLMQFRILFFSFRILLFTFPILLCQYQFCYSVSNSIIRFRIMFFQIWDFHSLFADGALGTSEEFSRDIANHGGLGRRRFTESITSSVYSVAGNPCIS